MRSQKNCFHLAIPCKDIEETKVFYEGLGCAVARQYDDRVTFNFFGDQLVCHLSADDITTEPKLYPRHFGITFLEKSDFEELHSAVERNGLKFFKELSSRFVGRREEHIMFFLIDPSNNILEFKHYFDPEMMY
jgi:extradiol dioxygenase family protein